MKPACHLCMWYEQTDLNAGECQKAPKQAHWERNSRAPTDSCWEFYSLLDREQIPEFLAARTRMSEAYATQFHSGDCPICHDASFQMNSRGQWRCENKAGHVHAGPAGSAAQLVVYKRKGYLNVDRNLLEVLVEEGYLKPLRGRGVARELRAEVRGDATPLPKNNPANI